MNWETGFSVLFKSLNSASFSPFTYSGHATLTGHASSATALASTAAASWGIPTHL